MKYLGVSEMQSNQDAEGEMYAHIFCVVLMGLEKSDLLQ